MRASKFTLKEIHKLGFVCSNDAWKSAKVHSDHFIPGAQVEESRGRKKISKVVVENIRKFLCNEKISRLAANRTVKIGLKVINVRYLNTSVSDTYQAWIEKCKKSGFKKISLANFRKLISQLKFIKKPKKESDKCEICVSGRVIEKKIGKLSIKKVN